MIAASVDYRLKTRDKVRVPLECVKDAKSAIRFLRKNARLLKVDPDRIVAAGGSAGGQLAAATAMIDAKETSDDQYDLSISCRPDAVILYNPWFRCQTDLSPPSFVAGGLPPFITFLGDRDPTPVESLLAFHQALKKARNASEYYVGKGGKEIRWQWVQCHDPMVTPADPAEYAIYYAYTEVYCDRPMDLWVAVGSDDKANVWLNAMPIWISSDKLKGWQVNEGFRKVTFKAGVNRVLYRVENGWLNIGFSFAIRVAP